MMEKKTEMVAFRLSETRKRTAEEICERYGHTPGSMAGLLFESFLRQCEMDGARLVWPPVFNYYPAGTQTFQEVEDAKSGTGGEDERISD